MTMVIAMAAQKRSQLFSEDPTVESVVWASLVILFLFVCVLCVAAILKPVGDERDAKSYFDDEE